MTSVLILEQIPPVPKLFHAKTPHHLSIQFSEVPLAVPTLKPRGLYEVIPLAKLVIIIFCYRASLVSSYPRCGCLKVKHRRTQTEGLMERLC